MMAMKCKKCGGIIPDVTLSGSLRHDCDNHYKPEVNIKLGEVDS